VDSTIIPQEDVWKTLPTYSLLPRRHVTSLLLLPTRLGTDLFSPFTTVYGPHEVFFGTWLSVLGLLRQDGDDEVLRVPPVFALWRHINDPSPVTWDVFEEGWRRAREKGSLLCRKFRGGVVDVEGWEEVVSRRSRSREKRGRSRSRSREGKGRSRSRSRERRRRDDDYHRHREDRRSR